MSFNSQIDKFIKKSKRNPDQVVKAAFVELSNRIIMRTPIKSGRARGNWFAAVGSPDFSTSNSTGAAASMARVTSAVSAGLSGRDFTLYLTNSLPYVYGLEYYGRSAQAPEGMVRVSVNEYNELLARKVREL